MLAPTAQMSEELAGALEQIFPLPLATIESFMLADGRSEYPMMADLEMQFRGRIERGAFDAALAWAMARAPLFRSTIRREGKRFVWQLTDQMPVVDWASFGTPLGDSYDRFIDLRHEPAFRVWVRDSDERSTVRLHFHHACADGIGGFAFIEDFLAGYALAQEQPIKPRALKPERLVSRGTPSTEHRGIYRGIKDQFIGAREGSSLLPSESGWTCCAKRIGPTTGKAAGWIRYALFSRGDDAGTPPGCDTSRCFGERSAIARPVSDVEPLEL